MAFRPMGAGQAPAQNQAPAAPTPDTTQQPASQATGGFRPLNQTPQNPITQNLTSQDPKIAAPTAQKMGVEAGGVFDQLASFMIKHGGRDSFLGKIGNLLGETEGAAIKGTAGLGVTGYNIGKAISTARKEGPAAGSAEMEKSRNVPLLGKIVPSHTGKESTGEAFKKSVGAAADVLGAAGSVMGLGEVGPAVKGLTKASGSLIGEAVPAIKKFGSKLAADAPKSEVVAGVKKVGQKLAERKSEKIVQQAAEQMSPELRGNAKVAAYTKDFGSKTKTTFITGEQNLSPNDQAIKLAKKFESEFKGAKTTVKKQQALGEYMKKTETELNAELEKDPTPIIKRAFNDGLDEIKSKGPEEFKTTDSMYNKAMDFAKKHFANAEPNVKGLRKSRSAFDAEFKKNYPSAVKDGKIDTSTAAGAAWKDARDYMNDYMYNTAKKGSKLKELIGNEADALRANELLGKSSAQKHGTNRVKRFIQQHPVISSTGGAVAGAIGVEGVKNALK